MKRVTGYDLFRLVNGKGDASSRFAYAALNPELHRGYERAARKVRILMEASAREALSVLTYGALALLKGKAK